MKLPSHTTVIAYLALFVALGGSAYAATQLPKNSVGSKQIKPNAVTTAKLKNGAVTGAKIGADTVTGSNVDESTLGRVPSAASAESATTAGHATSATSASDAKALGGVPLSGFLRTDSVQFNSGALNACFAQDLVEIPGWFEMTTVGDCKSEFKFKVSNPSSEDWLFITDTAIQSIGSESSSVLSYAGFNIDLFVISATDPSKHALIDCAYQTTTPARISCSTRIPPAA